MEREVGDTNLTDARSDTCMTMMSLCCEVISSFVIFHVLVLPSTSLLMSFQALKTAEFFTLVFAVFLHDIASAYKISSKCDHPNGDMTSYVDFSRWRTQSRKSTPGFGFIDGTHSEMSKSICIPNLDEISQSTVILLPVSENRPIQCWGFLHYWLVHLGGEQLIHVLGQTLAVDCLTRGCEQQRPLLTCPAATASLNRCVAFVEFTVVWILHSILSCHNYVAFRHSHRGQSCVRVFRFPFGHHRCVRVEFKMFPVLTRNTFCGTCICPMSLYSIHCY